MTSEERIAKLHGCFSVCGHTIARLCMHGYCGCGLRWRSCICSRLRNSIRTVLPRGKPGGKATSRRAWCRFHTLRPDASPQHLWAKLDWLVRQRAAGDIFPYVIRHQSYLVCGSATDANVLCAAPVRVQRTNPRTRHYASNLTVNLRVCFA